MSEQRYSAVLAVISEGRTVTEVAARFGVSRRTIRTWLAKYEAGGLEGLGDGSHRPFRSCPPASYLADHAWIVWRDTPNRAATSVTA